MEHTKIPLPRWGIRRSAVVVIFVFVFGLWMSLLAIAMAWAVHWSDPPLELGALFVLVSAVTVVVGLLGMAMVLWKSERS